MKLFSIGRALAVVALAVGSIAATAGPASAAPVQPKHVVCDDEQTYKITSHSLSHLVQTVPTVQLVNHSHGTNTLTTGVSVTGSVSISVSGSITTEESVIVASSKQQLGLSVTATLSGTWDVHASMPVRPGKIGYIHGGIFRVETIGTYTHIDQICRVTKGTVTAYTPYHYGYITTGG